MITEFRSLRIKLAAISFGALLPLSSVQAGGWWNQKSVVAVPIGQPIGTVQGAVPYQIYTAPAARAAAYAPAYSYSTAHSYAPAYSYAPPVNYSAAQYSTAPVYGFAAPAPNQQAFSLQLNPQSAAPANGSQDLAKQIADTLRQSQAAATPAAQSAASSTQLSSDEIAQLRDLIKRQSSPTAQSAGPASQTPQQAVGYVPVLVGYTQPMAAAVQPAYTAPAAATTMSLVPVQLYRQKNFLGIEKLKPVSVYPYGVR